jgi:hypothetical protein
MTAKKPRKISPAKPRSSLPSRTVSATEFPALRTFLRGYFHQDMKEEYGSAEEALREFCADASPEEIQSVAENWSRFLAHLEGQPLEELNRILIKVLGSSYALTSEDVGGISAILSRSTQNPKR